MRDVLCVETVSCGDFLVKFSANRVTVFEEFFWPVTVPFLRRVFRNRLRTIRKIFLLFILYFVRLCI